MTDRLDTSSKVDRFFDVARDSIGRKVPDALLAEFLVAVNTERKATVAAITQLLQEERREAELASQKSQVEMMATILRELGGELKVHPTSFVLRDNNDVVEVQDDPATGVRTYRLQPLTKEESNGA